MKQYDYFLLDWDGNLAKTLDIWLEAFRAPLLQRGFAKTDEEIAASFGAYPQCLIDWGVQDPENVGNEADQIAKKTLPQVELYPDALEVLQGLHARGKHLALITSSYHDNIEHLLEKYNLQQFFEVVIAGDDVTHHKPHTEPLEKALAALGGTKDKAIIIGDSDKDIGAANNFGIDCILFYPPEHRKFYNLDTLKGMGPTHVLEDFRDVLNFA